MCIVDTGIRAPRFRNSICSMLLFLTFSPRDPYFLDIFFSWCVCVFCLLFSFVRCGNKIMPVGSSRIYFYWMLLCASRSMWFYIIFQIVLYRFFYVPYFLRVLFANGLSCYCYWCRWQMLKLVYVVVGKVKRYGQVGRNFFLLTQLIWIDFYHVVPSTSQWHAMRSGFEIFFVVAAAAAAEISE